MTQNLLRGITALLLLTTALLAGPREAQWKSVEEARRQRVPQTAIAALEPIIRDALADRAYPEAIKAVALRMALAGEIQGEKPEEKIIRLQAELPGLPAAMHPALEAILAHWYWEYFEANRWQLAQRTATSGAPGVDIRTWDLARILAEIDRHFTAALADEKTLQATPVGAYDDLLVAGSAPDRYRPTLFDFLAHEALQFYQTGESAALDAEDEFEVEASGPIFGDTAEFAHWHPVTSDPSSPKLKAIRLYQSLLNFHQADTDRSACDDDDLGRLAYGLNIATGEDKVTRYETALERFIQATAAREISARALADLARQVNADGAPARAHELAQRGLDAFPVSAGGALCHNLIQEIEAKSAALETEAVWNAPWPTLNVTYRNVTKVYFRAVPVDFAVSLSRTRWNFGGIDADEKQRLLSGVPALEWSADLPPTSDFVARTEKLPAPTALKPGYYFILASHDPSFGEKDNQVSATPVWVSDLALVLRANAGGAARSGLVLKANSGEPVPGATVRIWRRGLSGWYNAAEPTTTDRNGRFEFASENSSTIVLAEADGQAVASSRELYSYHRAREDRARTQTVFFTDRSIYRPGQTISFKAVTIRYDQSAGKYAALARHALTVVFYDPNGKEIARTSQTTNDYGSISGVFTAPRDRLTGRMSLQILGSFDRTDFNIEEYKRPKFQVEIAPPAAAAKLGAPFAMTGKATAYSGAAIGGAKVKWRVERGVQLPPWCWWWRPTASKAIAHGTAATEPDGSFAINFPAEPDPAVPAKNEPVFVFTIHADVTDASGETRSTERTIRAGYTALRAGLTAAAWQTAGQPVDLTVATRSLDGEPQPAEGVLTIRALHQPADVSRGPLADGRFRWLNSASEPAADPANPETWEPGEIVSAIPFKTDTQGPTHLAAALPAGIYRASVTTKDRFGKPVSARLTLEVVDPTARKFGLKLANYFAAPKWSVEPGEKFSALWGTGYVQGRAYVEVECNGKTLAGYWTSGERTQESVNQAVTEEMRGGFTVRVTYVRENRAYLNERVVDVPWSNQQLTVKWESFRSKLTPGQKETWTAVVTGPDAKGAAAEMVATLYDASLDQFLPHQWPDSFEVFRRESWASAEFENTIRFFQAINHGWSVESRTADWTYRRFPEEIATNTADGDVIVLSPFMVSTAAGEGYHAAAASLAGTRIGESLHDAPVDVSTRQALQDTGINDSFRTELSAPAADQAGNPGGVPPKPVLARVIARKNFNETAFFFPRLLAADDGTVRMTFTVPEALTQWKFLGFAHDRQLRAGLLTGTSVTAKDLMIEANPPRFVREGDAIEFTVKVSNQSEQPQSGSVKLTFTDAATLQPMDAALGNLTTEQPFSVPARQSRTYFWRIVVPDGTGFLTYKAVGATAQLSDGEEGYLPVLSRRILVTESLPLSIQGPATRQFEFTKLLASGQSDSLRHQALTVQMVSQPAWYAVMALPYLMEYPYECSEQVFNRFYANALARHIANSDPKIRRIFDQWKNTAALDSPLEKNRDLKSVLIEETPWQRQAASESQSRRNVGLLFDRNRLDDETARVLAELDERQFGDGLWSWFPGGRPSEYISLYIMTGFGRLRHLGVAVDVAPAVKSLAGIDAWMEKKYRSILKAGPADQYVPTPLDAFYLYGRSFFLADRPIAKNHREAVDFFLARSRQCWTQVDSRQSQAHLALALQRFGDKETPRAIMNSIKEYSVSDPELGRFWRDPESGWWWYHAPIETQAVMIEAFTEVAQDRPAVEDCRTWLLRQKQTQDWKTTRATADAIYALLLGGKNPLGSDARVEVTLGGTTIKPESVEAGTGFYEKKFVRDEVKPALGRITVTKRDEGVSWGSVNWQYLEDVAKVSPAAGTPLHLTKTLYVRNSTKNGATLVPVTGPLAVGDELVVRLELRADRDMEFVHLKDQRGSGTEPVNVLSGYKFQDGLAYYESTRDTASHFFIDYLPKGVHVFEYSTRIQLKGTYQTGIAEIQCMYAPEFNSHSESFALEVR